MTTVTAALGVPIDSVGREAATSSPFGTELMPKALRDAGLLSRLGIPDRGDLNTKLEGSTRDVDSGLVAWPSLIGVTNDIRRGVAELVAEGERPLLLGGCCALLPGAVAGLADAAGSSAVVNIDGHLDLYDAKTSPTGEAADMPIAALLGVGVPKWSAVLGDEPTLTAGDVALVGFRDFDEAASLGSTMPEDIGIHRTWDAAAVSGQPRVTGREVVEHVSHRKFWVHLDLDVLDEAVLPATDYLMPGGLTWPVLEDLLHPLVHADQFAGLSIACLNPQKDPGGRCAHGVADSLVRVLSSEC